VAIKYGLPREAVRSERPFSKGRYVGEVGVMARGGVCALACTGVGTFVGRGCLFGDNYNRGSLWGRGFCPECSVQMSVVWSTLMSVIMQNLNEISQSSAEL